MNFAHWPPGACIHLCDLELPRSINVKYGVAEIPQRMPRIFTTNRVLYDLFSTNATEEERAAIERRVHIVNLFNKLY